MPIITLHHFFFFFLFLSLFELVCDCFGPLYSSTLPQKNTEVQNNHLRTHTMSSLFRKFLSSKSLFWISKGRYSERSLFQNLEYQNAAFGRITIFGNNDPSVGIVTYLHIEGTLYAQKKCAQLGFSCFWLQNWQMLIFEKSCQFFDTLQSTSTTKFQLETVKYHEVEAFFFFFL